MLQTIYVIFIDVFLPVNYSKWLTHEAWALRRFLLDIKVVTVLWGMNLLKICFPDSRSFLGLIQCGFTYCRRNIQNKETNAHISHIFTLRLLLQSLPRCLNLPFTLLHTLSLYFIVTPVRVSHQAVKIK